MTEESTAAMRRRETKTVMITTAAVSLIQLTGFRGLGIWLGTFVGTASVIIVLVMLYRGIIASVGTWA